MSEVREMWIKSSVLSLLERYAEDKARVEHLKLELDEMNKLIRQFEKNIHLIVDPLKAQQLTGMPHGTAISDPTASTAVRLASGWIPTDLKDLRDEANTLQEELDKTAESVAYVDAWMLALTEREAWLIRKQVIGKEFWRDIIDDYARDYQIRVSQDSLGRLKTKALKKIYKAAGVVD